MDGVAPVAVEGVPQIDLVALERDKIKGAIRTDFILSAAMAIAEQKAQNELASARSSAAPSPCHALPCMHASTLGCSRASFSSVAAVCGAWA